MKNIKKEENVIFDKLSRVIIIISGVIIAFSFVAPLIFVQESNLDIDFNKTGSIGDTIGGIMNPFIALAGIFLTFLAFYIQLIANKLQRDSFRKEMNEQKAQFNKNQFENQFYEMVRLHKENVNDISVTIVNSYFSGVETLKSETRISGREVFRYFLNEINILYIVAVKIFEEDDNTFFLNKAYNAFFHGIDYMQKNQSHKLSNKKLDLYISQLKIIRESSINDGDRFDSLMKDYKIKAERYRYNLFCGHSSLLSHYYRHLFQTVKFVANQDESLINYSEKRKYLRILRAQLSDQEQAMLFYNWKSKFGMSWENETNHFFTNYRMIHNLYNELINEDFDLIEIFKLNEEPYYETEYNRYNDTLFEFQDW